MRLENFEVQDKVKYLTNTEDILGLVYTPFLMIPDEAEVIYFNPVIPFHTLLFVIYAGNHHLAG